MNAAPEQSHTRNVEPLVDLPMLVLAGGFGTRISAVVGDVPKALAPVAGYPHLFHMMTLWRQQGVRHFIFLLHYRAEQIENYVRELQAAGELGDFEAEFVTEPSPLGTGGAIANAVRECRLTGDFLVTNADTWLDGGPRELAASAGASICVVRRQDTSRYGRVSLEGTQIAAFEEKCANGGPGYINAGMYKLGADLFNNWNGDAFSVETSLLSALAAKGALGGVVVDANFIDMGVPEDYFRFQAWVEGGKCGHI